MSRILQAPSSQPMNDMILDLQSVAKVMEVLSDLTIDFMEAFATKKKRKT